MKQCSKCKKEQSLSEFFNDKKGINKLTCTCKSCYKENNIRYKRTERGLISIMYWSQVESSKKRNHVPPNYTKHDLIMWVAFHPDFDKLYNNWVESGYNKKLIPSCDRLNDSKPYTFKNLRLVTWKDNHKKQGNDKINGKNNSISRPLLQYDKQDNFIKEYYSQAQASRETGINRFNIWAVCNNKSKSAGGYKWEYKQ